MGPYSGAPVVGDVRAPFMPLTPTHTYRHTHNHILFNGLGNSHTPACTRNSWLSMCTVQGMAALKLRDQQRGKGGGRGGGQGAPEVATAGQVFFAAPDPLSFSPFAHPKRRHSRRGSSCLESPSGCTRGRDQLPDNSWEEAWKGVQGEETAIFQMFNAATGKLTP